MILYSQLGPQKKLNEVVFAGSHDAGITFGDANVQTQSIDIFEQASAGVRIFDLRITAISTDGATGGAKNAQLVAFHADGMVKKDETKTRYLADLGRNEAVTRTKFRGGGYGMTLESILADAKRFVEKEKTEFLLLKFDKCTNWPLIAEACVTRLKGVIYTGGGNLNTKTLQQLAGHVVVLFTPKGLGVVKTAFPPSTGILGIQNLADGAVGYRDNYDGVQYHGKGGTSPFNAYNKMSQNQKKQAKLMAAGGHGDPEIMGMMYWTTTGLKESIYKRNAKMWNDPGKAKLKALWAAGMQESVKSGAPKSVNLASSSAGAVIKAFMPNFVMIDFSDEEKCDTIYSLNTVTGNQLVQLEEEWEMVELEEI